ncbi:MAG TPA: glycosyltransferase family A protein [Bacteroidia bacterium]|nr:glycosyltransferase family A protein [Bacteroidia bacterium]
MKKRCAILSVHYNNSQFIIPQIQCIRKFCADQDYDIIIVDNSDKGNFHEAIKYHAERLGAIYMRTQASSSDGSQSHAFALNTGFQRFKDDYKEFLFLDHDNFPIKEFSVSGLLIRGFGECIVIAGLGQGQAYKYFWAGCFAVDLNTQPTYKKVQTPIGSWKQENVPEYENIEVPIKELIDFSPNHELKLDTGGNLHKIIEAYGEKNCAFWDEKYCQNPNFSKSQYTSYALINNEMFMHFIAGSNWIASEAHEERINSLLGILKEKTGITFE